MSAQNLDYYDIFNDYLGLSNVVGGQDDPYLWMQSLLGKRGELKEPAIWSENFTDGANACHGLSQNYEYEASGSSGCPSPNVKAGNVLSDVERLFGRGAILHKRPQCHNQPKLSNSSPVENSKVSNAGWAQPNPPAPNSTAGICTGNSATKYARDRVPAPVSGDQALQAALDAVLSKYDYLYSQQKPTQGVASAFQNPKNVNSVETFTSTSKNAALFPQHTAGETYQFFSAKNNANPPSCAQVQGMMSSGLQNPATRFVGCSFCKNNKEVKEWFMSHQLKDNFGRVTCPVLRSYECPLCDATGDNAHTIGHCPLNPDRRNSLPLAIRAKANATGKRKYA